MYRYLTAQFQDRMTPLDIRIEGDRAVVSIRDTFTARQDVADFMGAPLKQGESLELRLRGTYQVADSKFVHITIEPA